MSANGLNPAHGNGTYKGTNGTSYLEAFIQGVRDSDNHVTVPDTRIAPMPSLPVQAYIEPSVADGASPWLDQYTAFSRQWSPRSYDGFHEAVGLWLLSTVASRRVTLDLGGKRYTNLYIAFAASTSIYAKSTATKIGIELLKEANLSYLLAPDDSTPQAFVKKLAGHPPETWSEMPREKQLAILERIASAGQRGWFYEEFGQKVSAMMRDGGHMSDFRGLLRKFDDNPEVYEYVSIGRGSDTISAPYLALLANLTPADLRPFARRSASLWGDGFWARFAFVTPPPGTPRSRARFPGGERIMPLYLVKRLREWHKKLGIPKAQLKEKPDGKNKSLVEVVIDRPKPVQCTLGEGVYDAFYRYGDALADIVEHSPDHDLAGNYIRFAEKALRVAMLLGSIENGNRIEMPHWARAQQIAESFRQCLHWLYDDVTGSAKSRGEEFEERIMALIEAKGPRTKREICQSIKGIDSPTAETYLKSMVSAGMLEQRDAGNTSRYFLVG